MGIWTDLLKWVELGRDRVRGEWKRVADKIASQGNYSRLMFPVVIRGSYDLEVTPTRHQGRDAVLVYLPVGSHACYLALSGGNGAPTHLRSWRGNASMKTRPPQNRGSSSTVDRITYWPKFE